MPNQKERILKGEIARTMALLYQKGLVTTTGGNASARISGSNHFLITPSGLFKGNLRVEEILKVPLEGKVRSGKLKPSVETPLHSKIYRSRSDVLAVIHAHSPVTLGVTFAGIEIKPITPESLLFVGSVPVVQFEAPGTEDLADKVVEALKSHSVAVMQNHGVVAVGKNLLEALNRIEVVELTARIMTITHIWGGTATLTDSQLAQLKRLVAE